MTHPSQAPVPIAKQTAHALWFSAGSLALGLAYNVIVARAFGPEGKGLLDLASATIALLSLALGCSLGVGMTRQHASTGRKGRWTLTKLLLHALACSALACVVLELETHLQTAFPLLPQQHRAQWSILVLSGCFLGIFGASLRGAEIGSGGMINCNRVDLAAKVLITGAACVCVVSTCFFRHDWASPLALMTLTLSAGLFQVIAYTLLMRRQPEDGSFPIGKILLGCIPVHATNLLHFVTHRIDVFFVSSADGPQGLGIYSVAVSMSQLTLLASAAFAQPLLPAISAARTDKEQWSLTASTCRLYLAGAMIVLVGTATAIPWCVPLLFGTRFEASIRPLFVLLPGALLFGLTNILISHLVGVGRSGTNLAISVITGVITLAGNATLTPKYGYIAAAWLSTAAYSLAALLSVACIAGTSIRKTRELLIPGAADFVGLWRALCRFRP